jgi:hypothetical protein
MVIFIEQQVIPPVRIALEFLGAPEHRPPAALITQEYSGQPIGDLAGDLEQVHRVTRAGRTLYPEVITVIQIVLQESANQERIDGHPNWPAPV